MTKDTKAHAAELPPEAAKLEKSNAVPRWIALIGLLLIVLGLAYYFTEASRRRTKALEAFNSASVKVEATEDGLQSNFAQPVVLSNRRDYLEILGACSTNPRLALDIFRGVMEQGTGHGRILALRMSFFLVRDAARQQREIKAGRKRPGALTEAELNEILQTVTAQLEADKNTEVRCVAQWSLSQVLCARDLKVASKLVDLPPKPLATKGEWLARTKELKQGEEGAEIPILLFQWSTPDACLAWWKKFGASAKWDLELERFVVTAE